MRSCTLMAILILTGCAGNPRMMDTETIARFESYEQVLQMRDGFRAELDAARKLDPELRIGFFSVPWLADYGLAGDGAEVGSLIQVPDQDPGHDERLLAAVRADLAAGSWQEPGRHATIRDGWLVVFQHENVLQLVTPWVEEYRSRVLRERGVVELATGILRVDERRGAAVCGVLGIESFPDTAQVYPVTAEQTRAIRDLDGITVLSSPTLSVLSGQQGSLTVSNETAYIADWDVMYINGRRIVDPVVRTLRDGIAMELRPTLTDDRKSVSVVLSVHIADLHGFERTTLDVGHDAELMIDLPQIDSTEVAATFERTLGDSVVVAAPGLAGEHILVLLTSR